MSALPAMLTAAEASAFLRTSRRNLGRLIADGRLGSIRQGEAGGARRLIPKAAIAKYLRSLEVK